MKDFKTLKGFENLSEWEQENLKKVYKTILAGEIYARIESVSRSGMIRNIVFYMVDKKNIVNISDFIGWLTGWTKLGEYNRFLKVGGCGMDMIFHSLYVALDTKDAQKWKQGYRML